MLNTENYPMASFFLDLPTPHWRDGRCTVYATQKSKKEVESFTDNKLEVVEILNGIMQHAEIPLFQCVFT